MEATVIISLVCMICTVVGCIIAVRREFATAENRTSEFKELVMGIKTEIRFLSEDIKDMKAKLEVADNRALEAYYEAKRANERLDAIERS